MPNFPKKNPVEFPAAVPIIETLDLVLGGLGNGPNRADQPLVDRTDFLKKAVEDVVANSQNLVIGRDVQAWATVLDSLKALTTDGVLRKTGTVVTTVTRWIDNSCAKGRLTLETNKPFNPANTVSDRVFYTPYTGNTIALYVSNEWQYLTFSELSFPLTGIPAGKNVDVFAIASGQNAALSLEQWTNDTTRAVVLTRADGVWVAANNFGRRYLGTLRTSALSECVDTETKRFLWNVQNQLVKPIRKRPATSSPWTYSGTAWRPSNNDLTNRAEMVCGISEVIALVNIVGVNQNRGAISIGLNTITTAEPASSFGLGLGANDVNSHFTTVGCWAQLQPLAGYNFLQMLEVSPYGLPAQFDSSFTAMSGRWDC